MSDFYIKDRKLYHDNTPITEELSGLVYDDVSELIEGWGVEDDDPDTLETLKQEVEDYKDRLNRVYGLACDIRTESDV